MPLNPLPLSDIVSTTMNDFLNYALTIILVMLIYYIGKFFFVPPKSQEPSLEERRAALKKGIDWVKSLSPKEKKEKEKELRQQERQAREEEREVRQEEKELEGEEDKVERGEQRSRKITSNLLKVIACINKAIQQRNDKGEAKKWIHRAKRHMIRARDVDIIEKITQGTLHHDKALEIRHYLVQMREALDSIPLEEAALKRFNQNLGAVVSAIGQLIARLYEQVEVQRQAAQQKKGKAVGARPVARLRTR